jgi:hypothetical protein
MLPKSYDEFMKKHAIQGGRSDIRPFNAGSGYNNSS